MKKVLLGLMTAGVLAFGSENTELKNTIMYNAKEAKKISNENLIKIFSLKRNQELKQNCINEINNQLNKAIKDGRNMFYISSSLYAPCSFYEVRDELGQRINLKTAFIYLSKMLNEKGFKVFKDDTIKVTF